MIFMDVGAGSRGKFWKLGFMIFALETGILLSETARLINCWHQE